LLTLMVIPVKPVAGVRDTTAIVPFAIGFAFIPLARQVYAAAPPAQLSVLPAAANTGPAVTLNAATLEEG
jgi:hypothetical protein